MDFNNNSTNNSNDNQKHVQTRVATYYNSKVASGTPCALIIVYYDDGARIQFAPELPKAEQTERRRYDYDHTIMTYVRRSKCLELYNAYQAVIVPALKEGKSAQVSIPLAQVNQIMLDTGVGEDGIPHPKLKYIKGIDPNTLIADVNNIVSYEFNTGEYILGYDETTGSFKEQVVTFNELMLFMEDLKNVTVACSNAYVHADRVVNKYWRDSLDNKLVQIGDKLGVDLSYRSTRSYGNGSQGSIFNQRTNNQTSVATQNTVNSLDALNQTILEDEDVPF